MISYSIFISLTFYTQHNAFQVHPYCWNGNISSFFLWLSAIPVCVCTHYIFIHLSFDGHLGCYHTLITTNHVALNIGVCIFFNQCFFKYSPRSGIPGLYSSFSFTWQVSILFSTVAAPVYEFPPTVYKGFLFLANIFVICVHFDDGHSDRCEMISHCGFNLHFPDD